MILAFLLFSTLSIACRCQESRCSLGIGLTSFIRAGVDINIGYGFCGHWTAEGGGTFRFDALTDWKSDLQKSHESDLGEQPTKERMEDLHIERIGIRYWPRKTFEGFCIGAGIRHGNATGVDWLIEAGYAARIWKGITGTVSYRIPLKETFRDKTITAKGITLSISYVF